MSQTVALPYHLPQPRAARIVSPFEFWPDWAIYTPVVLQWIALGLRHLDFSLPSAANPGVETGGLCGERKSALFDTAGPDARALLPAWGLVTPGGDVTADLDAAYAVIAARGLQFPIVIKPEIGCNGTGVRLVADAAALPNKLCGYPAGAALILQDLVPWQGEAGIFYVRHPDEPRGRITSLTLKCAPTVVGDGRSTLRQLVLTDPRAGRVPHIYLPRLSHRLHEIPAQGEQVRLVFSGNHCKGSQFRDGGDEITDALTDAVDRFAHGLDRFHFGRIDVRYESLAALRRGGGFKVIEVNGVGSEATHIWDPDTSLREAYATQFRHYAEAFRIGRAMKRRGAASCGGRELWQRWRLQRRLLRSYPLND